MNLRERAETILSWLGKNPTTEGVLDAMLAFAEEVRAEERKPVAYALRNDQGYWVGLWGDRETAEQVQKKLIHGEQIVSLYEAATNAAGQAIEGQNDLGKAKSASVPASPTERRGGEKERRKLSWQLINERTGPADRRQAPQPSTNKDTQ